MGKARLRSADAWENRSAKKAAKVAAKNERKKLMTQDWHCKDPACGNLNFARRDVCNLCGKPNDNRVEIEITKKKPKPVKKTHWKTNPSPSDKAENLRLRDLLEKERLTGSVCAELAGADRERARVLLDMLTTKRLKKAKSKSKKNVGNAGDPKEGTSDRADVQEADGVNAEEERLARKAAKKERKEKQKQLSEECDESVKPNCDEDLEKAAKKKRKESRRDDVGDPASAASEELSRADKKAYKKKKREMEAEADCVMEIDSADEDVAHHSKKMKKKHKKAEPEEE